MTDDTMNLRARSWRRPLMPICARDDRLLPFHRLMELEVEGLTGTAYGEKSPGALAPAQRLPRSQPGGPVPAPSSCAFPSCAKPPTSRAFSSRGGWSRRRSPRRSMSLRPGRLHPLRRRLGHGHELDLLEPGVVAVRRDRRQGESLSQSPDRGRLVYLWIDTIYVKHARTGASSPSR